jgi:hypothetical protein
MSSRLSKVVLGAIAGGAVGVACVVILTCISVFVAVSESRSSTLLGVVTTSYDGSDRGGFALDVSWGPGIVVALLAPAVVLAVLAVVRSLHGPRPRARP